MVLVGGGGGGSHGNQESQVEVEDWACSTGISHGTLAGQCFRSRPEKEHDDAVEVRRLELPPLRLSRRHREGLALGVFALGEVAGKLEGGGIVSGFAYDAGTSTCLVHWSIHWSIHSVQQSIQVNSLDLRESRSLNRGKRVVVYTVGRTLIVSRI